MLRDRRLVQATWASALAICATATPDVLAQRWRNLPPLLLGLAALASSWSSCGTSAATPP